MTDPTLTYWTEYYLREARARIKELWELEPNGTTSEDLLYFMCTRLDECEEFFAQFKELA